jgi:sortase A
MRDKRPVDELSIEELERILAVRKREARLARVRRYEGRRVTTGADIDDIDDEANETNEIVDSSAKPPTAEAPTKGAAYVQPTPTPPADPAPVAVPKDYYDGEPQFEDELDSRHSNPRQRGEKRSGKGKPVAIIWNRALLVVEIAAVFGLIFLVVSLFQSLQSITETSANIQAQYQATANAGLVPPTATPLINIKAVVLAGGHTVRLNEKGEVVAADFNLDEVPAQYREQYEALNLQPLVQPTPSPGGPVRIKISKIDVDASVVSGDSWQVLQLGVGHHIGSANPGQRGNMVLSAHNDVYGEIFRHLDRLQPGDSITVWSTDNREYTYRIQDPYRVVNPTDVWVLDSRGEEKKLTLISCYPYRVDTKRIVVFATLQQ